MGRIASMELNLNLEDISQIVIGAFALAVPISFSEESWNMAETLEGYNLLLLFGLSVLFLGFFAYQNVFQGKILYRIATFIIRIFVAYGIAALVVVLVLVSIGKFPIFTDSFIAVKRLVLVTMPASMGAIVVDSFDKE